MSRIAFLVDGFNLYYSLKDAQLADKGRQTRWLNLRALCEFYLPKLQANATVGPIRYFSAYATHAQKHDPKLVDRHERYVRCLEATGVVAEMGWFQRGESVECFGCHRVIPGAFVEKESDVGLGVRLLDLLVQEACEGAVIISGDTDQCPAIRTARRLFPKHPVYVCFPYARENESLKAVASGCIAIKKSDYRQLQFSNPFQHPSGKQISMPDEWKNIA